MLTAFATLRSISEPLDAARVVELKLTLSPMPDLEGEVYLRVPTGHAPRYTIGAVYAVNFLLMPE
jgi:hypothetical protein